MKTTRQEKILELIDQRQFQLHYEHEREYLAKLIDSLVQKEIDGNRLLIQELWGLWESMAECGELSIGPKFSKNYNSLKNKVTKIIS